MRLWLDVEDLFAYAAHHARPSGVQRLSCEIYRALVARHGPGIGFLRHDPAGDGLRVIPAEAVLALYARMAGQRVAAPAATAPAHALRSRAHGGWLPREVRQPLSRAWRAQMAALCAGTEAVRALPALWRRPPPAALGEDLRAVARPGDVVAAFGSPWSEPGQADRLARAAAGIGARTALLVHDIIPIDRPEFCDRLQIMAFTAHMRAALPAADIVFTNSRATARAVSAWAQREKLVLRDAPCVLPIGTTPLPAPAVLPAALDEGGFVLMVGTLEARKNHWLAFRAWRRLLAEMPRGTVPRLVFAGRRGWMVDDLLQALDNSAWLDGMIRWLPEPDDATLAALYRGCRFTLFPSFVEGWGLPVAESLAAGRPCIATGHGAIEEAAAGFALPIDPDDVTGAVATLRRAIEDAEPIAACAARLRRDYQAVSWSQTAEAIMVRLAREGMAVSALQAPV